jgi:hypothetical protein
METPSPYKRATACTGKDLQTIVQTVLLLQQSMSRKQASSLAIRRWFTFRSPSFMSPSERYLTESGEPKEVKDFA